MGKRGEMRNGRGEGGRGEGRDIPSHSHLQTKKLHSELLSDEMSQRKEKMILCDDEMQGWARRSLE